MFGRKGIKRVELVESLPEEPQDVDEVGFSLDELGTAYEQAIQGAIEGGLIESPAIAVEGESQEAIGVGETIDAELDPAILEEERLEAPEAVESDGVHVTPETILEAMLFVGSSDNKPLAVDRFVELMRGVTPVDVQAMVDSLNSLYRAHHRAMEIVSEAGGYRMQLAKDMELVRDRFYGKVRETTLTQSAIDCLALVAYQPGVTREEIEKQWNQPAAAMLSTLVRKGMLRVDLGDRNATEGSESNAKQSKPTQRYFTTERFLEVIGLDSLHDLPQAEDL